MLLFKKILGFALATVCDEEKNAMLIAIGTILPTVLVSGMIKYSLSCICIICDKCDANFFRLISTGAIFPFEALPVLIQYAGYLLPGTLPGDALRSILLRGWGLSYLSVWLGFFSTFAWICVYWSITFIYLKYNKWKIQVQVLLKTDLHTMHVYTPGHNDGYYLIFCLYRKFHKILQCNYLRKMIKGIPEMIEWFIFFS